MLGRFDDAEPVARSSIERFDALGEVWSSVGPLNILAGIAAARGDLDDAATTYETLLERSRCAGQRSFVLFSLSRLAALRAKQGHDAAADGLYEEAIAVSFNPSVSADARVGQAAVARRLGDLARARALLDAASSYYRSLDHPAGQTSVLVGLAVVGAQRGPSRRRHGLCRGGRPSRLRQRGPGRTATRRTAVAAVNALTDPTQYNIEAFVGLARQRAKGLSYHSHISFQDEPDVAALAARLVLPAR